MHSKQIFDVYFCALISLCRVWCVCVVATDGDFTFPYTNKDINLTHHHSSKYQLPIFECTRTR